MTYDELKGFIENCIDNCESETFLTEYKAVILVALTTNMNNNSSVEMEDMRFLWESQIGRPSELLLGTRYIRIKDSMLAFIETACCSGPKRGSIEKIRSKRNRSLLPEHIPKNPYLLPAMKNKKDLSKLRNAYQYPENIKKDGHMATSSIECLVRRLGKRSGVNNAHPHRFRRTCATFALRRGMPIEQVSKDRDSIGRLPV